LAYRVVLVMLCCRPIVQKDSYAEAVLLSRALAQYIGFVVTYTARTSDARPQADDVMTRFVGEGSDPLAGEIHNKLKISAYRLRSSFYKKLHTNPKFAP